MTSDRVRAAAEQAATRLGCTVEEALAVMRLAASEADDAGEARGLLLMLGILPSRFRWVTADRYGRGLRVRRVRVDNEAEEEAS